MDSVGRTFPDSCAAASAARTAAVVDERWSASATSAGHFADTTHGSAGASAENTYPPTPSVPLASV
eukprot:4562116-Pleurochrysis_carterae.AAC.1